MLTKQYRKPAGNLYRFPRYYKGHPINSGIFLVINLHLEFRYQEYNI